MHKQPFLGGGAMIDALASAPGLQNKRRGVSGMGRNLDRHIDQLTAAVEAMQAGMRVIASGIDYARYNRFERLTPKIWRSGEDRKVQPEAGYAPTREEYEYCVQFVIDTALRMAEREAHTAGPSWRRA